MKLFCLRPLLFTKPVLIPSISPFSFYPQRSFPLCTKTSNHRRSSHYFDDVVPGRSAVYHHTLKFQRPATINWAPRLENSASFIGSVMGEPKLVDLVSGGFGVHTRLRVRRSNQPNSSYFWLRLMMWRRVAEIASKHLKPNDFIYVSGCLESYNRADDRGNLQLYYQLNVKNLNFVAQRPGYEDHKKGKSNETEVGIQKDRNRLHLWQVFFANPTEWWDQRNRKFNPRQPDFKHKDTGEKLWLSEYDPPWVKRQLELLDSKMALGTEVLVHWVRPPVGWCKLNTDGASKGNPGPAGCGGVIRNEDGRWLMGFGANVGICSAYDAEAWGIIHGLQLAWNEGYRKLIIECDNAALVSSLMQKSKSNSSGLLVRINYWLNRDWEVHIKHTYREGNAVADWLANWGLSKDLGVYFLPSPPKEIRPLVLGDVSGASMPRMISAL